MPFDLSIDNKSELVYFVLGVFTKKNFEGQGCMKKLLNHVFSRNEYMHKKIYLQAYHPEVYHSFGFQPSHYHQKIKPSYQYYQQFDKDQISCEYTSLKDIYDTYTKDFDEYRIRDDQYFKWLIERCKAFEEKIYIFKYKDMIDGYAIYKEEDNELYVSEIIYLSLEGFNRIIATLYQNTQNMIIECDLKAKIIGEKEEIVTMFSNHSYLQDKENKYINEVY